LHHGNTTVSRPAAYPHTSDPEAPEGNRLPPRPCVCTVSTLSSHTCTAQNRIESHHHLLYALPGVSTSSFLQAAVQRRRKQRSSLHSQRMTVLVMVKAEAAARSEGKQRTSKQSYGAKSKAGQVSSSSSGPSGSFAPGGGPRCTWHRSLCLRRRAQTRRSPSSASASASVSAPAS
jgi:hypothetical protein